MKDCLEDQGITDIIGSKNAVRQTIICGSRATVCRKLSGGKNAVFKFHKLFLAIF